LAAILRQLALVGTTLAWDLPDFRQPARNARIHLLEKIKQCNNSPKLNF
jgi:hypothetical protein